MGRRRGTPLDRADVIRAAIDLIAREGAPALGINRVARELGIQPPSMYHHVRSHEDLVRLVAIEGWRRLGAELADRPPSSDTAQSIEALASVFRRFVKNNRDLYRIMAETRFEQNDTEFEPVAAGILRDFAAVLAPFDYGPADLVHAIRALRAALHGFVSLEIAGQFGMPQSIDASFAWLVERLKTAIGPNSGGRKTATGPDADRPHARQAVRGSARRPMSRGKDIE